MKRSLFFVLAAALAVLPGWPRQELSVCGTHPDLWKEELQLHRKAERLRGGGSRVGLRAVAAAPASKDIGHIAILEDRDGVIARQNPFDLERRTVRFLPVNPEAGRYRFETTGDTYNPAEANSGAPLEGLQDDDTKSVPLPFPFPFFGASYQSVFVNSDGNLTFNAPDTATSDRSLGRLVAGPPRISPLFRDLDPSEAGSQGVRVLADPNRFVVSWVLVPEFDSFFVRQTFQVRLFPDGRLEFAYEEIGTDSAVVGIAPGNSQGSAAVVSFADGSTEEYGATIAERFQGTISEIDLVVAAQKYYETHEDAYDYLVFFNNLGIPASEGAVAFEITVRNRGRRGFGDVELDIGREFGSARRLQAILNLGPLSQYPVDPNAVVPARSLSRDTPLTILGHEAGHLFLAYASTRDPIDPDARPLLGRQLAHWSFFFNSEASLLEGNRIRDNGAAANPRFETIKTVEGYSPLDQYLMGFRAPEEVPATFLVVSPTGVSGSTFTPQPGVSFNGQRREVLVDEIIRAEGRRIPDHTVAQRRFRLAFILVTAAGTEPSDADIQKIETYRAQFEAFFREAASGRAVAETALSRSLYLSAFPAGGVVLGQAAPVTVSLAKPAEADTTILLRANGQGGDLAMPASVVIPAGGSEVQFEAAGLRAGVVELIAEVAGGGHEIAHANVQVLGVLSGVRLELVSGGKQHGQAGVPLPEPIVVRALDVNRLPYGGLRLNAAPTAGGTVTPSEAATDQDGYASFQWTPGPARMNELTLELVGAAPGSGLIVATLGTPEVNANGTVNAASYSSGITPGALASVFGVNLAAGAVAYASSLPLPFRLDDVQVLLNGLPAPLLYVSDRQINFLVPFGLQAPDGSAEVVVSTPEGPSAAVRVPVARLGPGIFFFGDNQGAVLVAGSGRPTSEEPAAPGQAIEIYCTGLGPVQTSPASSLEETVEAVQVAIDGQPATVLFSGLASGFVGLYQVNAEVPLSLAPGDHTLALTAGGLTSNAVTIRTR